VNEQLMAQGDFTPHGGRVAANALLALPQEQRPTAIFASNDQMAYGVLAAAEEQGVQVPGDVALVGFDDISSSAHIRPALTTVRQPFYEMGQRGIQVLLSLLDTPVPPVGIERRWVSPSPPPLDASHEHMENSAAQPIHVRFPTSLVVRASCGSPHSLAIPTSNVLRQGT
jgi:LacI family transcriptional regulator